LHEDVSIVPTEKFLEAATRAMGREVFSQELNDPQSLMEEFTERIPKAMLVELTGRVQVKQQTAM
jgi:hypothetical protein